MTNPDPLLYFRWLEVGTRYMPPEEPELRLWKVPLDPTSYDSEGCDSAMTLIPQETASAFRS